MSNFKDKMYQIDFGWGCWRDYSALPDPLSGYKGPTCKGREEGKKEWKEGTGPLYFSLLIYAHGVKYYTLHCIIHQEALYGRFLKMNDAIKVVVRIMNLIRGGNGAHKHRKFVISRRIEL